MKLEHELKQTITQDIVTEILNNKIFPRPIHFDFSDVRPSGLYTLGLVQNNSRFVTIDEQVLRSINLAGFILEKIEKGSWKNETVQICIVGSGFSGMSCALKLLEDKDKNIQITLLEKRHMLCPIQRNCQIRKVYPKMHLWPKVDLDSPESLHIVKNLEINSGITVGELAAKYVKRLVNESATGKIKILQDVSYLHISKASEDSNDLCVHGSGKLLNQNGQMMLESINRKFDICILATGFGIEANNSDFKQANLISYWRNDDRAQVPLYSKNSTYLISGYGDGAMSDLFRLKVYDYDPLQFLKELEKCIGKKLSSDSLHNTLKIDEWENKSFDVFETLEKFFSDSMAPSKLQNLASWIREDTNVVLHLKRSESMLPTVGYHQDSAAQAIKRILNNVNSLKYNRFLLYVLWKLHGFRIELSDSLEELVEIYKVPEENVLVRHGADKLAVLRDILSPSLFSITAQLMKMPAEADIASLKVA